MWAWEHIYVGRPERLRAWQARWPERLGHLFVSRGNDHVRGRKPITRAAVLQRPTEQDANRPIHMVVVLCQNPNYIIGTLLKSTLHGPSSDLSRPSHRP